MNLKKGLAYLVVFTALAIIGCKDKEPVEPDGSWIKYSANTQRQAIGTLELKDSSLFIFIAQQEGHTDTNGRYSLLEDQITFEDDTCFSPGTYTYSVSNKKLSFTLITDQCTERVKILEGTWSRIK